MRLLLLFLTISVSTFCYSQTITTDPAFPSASKAVNITFNATGTGLEGYTGDVYAHTGVAINNNNWQYVIEGWGNNETQPKLTNIDTDLYELKVTPSIREFYSVPADSNITSLCIVFRSADGGQQSEDIFIEIYEEVLSASIINPDKNLLIKSGEQINIEAASNFADSLTLYLNDDVLIATDSNKITTSITSAAEGKHWIWIEAKDANNSVYDSVYYYIRSEAKIAELPTGVHKGINYINDTTVTLVLHAPEKEFTYLIGDFNNWDVSLVPEMGSANPQQVSESTWMMNKTADGTHFWSTITGLEKGKEYAYQYYVDGNINIADPYTEKVLDPWNDKYISDETYPNLKAYPVDKTTEPVSVFQTAQEAYSWEASDFTMPALENMVIYEMLIRDFVETHSYKTIADTLDYLVKLGVNVLELMPINEFEGNSSWGYNPSFYFAPDKFYGPKNELKNLVDECHKRGIAVVIDMVLNHSYGQSPLLRLYYDGGKPAVNSPWYNVDNNFTNPDAHWGYDFNHESVHTQEFVDSVNAFWMSEYKIDGFRFDFTKGFGNNIKDASDSWGSKYDADRIRLLKRMADEIWKRNPNAFISFEHLSDNKEETELANYGINLWGNLNHPYNEATMGYNESNKSNFSGVSYKNRGWDNPNLVAYMESHDEERLMYKNLMYGNSNENYSTKELTTGLKRIELAANFFFTIPGPKMIWQFGELGYDISINKDCRVCDKPIKWDYYSNKNRKRIYDVFGALNKLRASESAFSTDDFTLNVNTALKSIHLNHTDMNVVVLGNFDIVEGSINPGFQSTGTWYEFYTGTEVEITDTEAEITLAPGEYHLYTTKKLATPDIIQDVQTQQTLKSGLNVYPNPVNDVLYLETEVELKQIAVYNSTGKRVLFISNIGTARINTENLKEGMYFILSTDTNNKQYSGKFIKQ